MEITLRLNMHLFVLVAILLFSCKKNNAPSSPPSNQMKCLLSSETSDLAGQNYPIFKYEYNKDGNLIKTQKFIATSLLKETRDIGGYTVRNTSTEPLSWIYDFVYEGDIHLGSPKSMTRIVTDHTGLTNRKLDTEYTFIYDAKGRIISVQKRTPLIPNDIEVDYNFGYNDKNNVTSIVLHVFTGPIELDGTYYTISDYDDKPTPYAGIKNWAIILNEWGSYDPVNMITALSSNNPKKITSVSGDKMVIDLSYEYNVDGYPIKRATNHNDKYIFTQTFAYNCK